MREAPPLTSLSLSSPSLLPSLVNACAHKGEEKIFSLLFFSFSSSSLFLLLLSCTMEFSSIVSEISFSVAFLFLLFLLVTHKFLLLLPLSLCGISLPLSLLHDGFPSCASLLSILTLSRAMEAICVAPSTHFCVTSHLTSPLSHTEILLLLFLLNAPLFSLLPRAFSSLSFFVLFLFSLSCAVDNFLSCVKENHPSYLASPLLQCASMVSLPS